MLCEFNHVFILRFEIQYCFGLMNESVIGVVVCANIVAVVFIVTVILVFANVGQYRSHMTPYAWGSFLFALFLWVLIIVSANSVRHRFVA